MQYEQLKIAYIIYVCIGKTVNCKIFHNVQSIIIIIKKTFYKKEKKNLTSKYEIAKYIILMVIIKIEANRGH